MSTSPARVSASEDPVTAWAQAVEAGEVVAGPYVRAAADRHLRDLVEGPKRGLKWDLVAALRAIRFFPQVLRLNGGQFEGRPFELHPSQAFRIGSLFGWQKYSAQHGAWLRRFTRFYDEEGKGNGKSPMLGGIGLYMMVADGEPRAEIYAAAAKKDQAGILFQDAVAMVDQSPVLKRTVQQQGENPVWQMTYRGRGGDKRKFKPLSAEKAQSGPRPHCALTDEVHARHHLGLVHHLGEIFLIDGDPQQRVHLHPAARVILPVIAFIQRADEGKCAVILDSAGHHIDAMLVLFPADRFFVGAGVCGHAQERLFAELKAPLQHIDHIPVGMLKRNGIALVGERGPELVNLPRGARVSTAQATRGALSGGGVADIRVFVDQDGNWRAAVEQIAGAIAVQTSSAAMQMQDRKTSGNLQNHLNRKG